MISSKALLPFMRSTKSNNKFKLFSRQIRSLSEVSSTSQDPSKKISSHRETILNNSISYVHQYGWTKDAIAQGVLSSKLPPSLTGLVTPNDLISHFMTESNSNLRNYLQMSNSSQSTSKNNTNDNASISKAQQIQNAIKYRLEMVIPFIQSEKWHEGMALGACQNTVSTSLQLEELVSILVHETSSNNSENESIGPVERMALGCVYVATELHLLADSSDGYIDTWMFLSQRMSEYEKLFLSSNGISMDGTFGSPIPVPPLPDKNMIIGASAVGSSLASAVLSLALPNVRAMSETMMPSFPSTNGSTNTFSTLQNLIQTQTNRISTNPVGNSDDSTNIEEQNLLNSLPPFDKNENGIKLSKNSNSNIKREN